MYVGHDPANRRSLRALVAFSVLATSILMLPQRCLAQRALANQPAARAADVSTQPASGTRPAPPADADRAARRAAVLEDELLRVEVELRALERKQKMLEEERDYLQEQITGQPSPAPQPEGIAPRPPADKAAPRGDRGSDRNAEAVAAANSSPLIIGDRTDITSLGVAMIDARGALKLAEHDLAKFSAPAADPAAQQAAKIKLQTARNRVDLLTTIAEAAYDAAKSELGVQEKLAARVRVLNQKGYSPAAGVEQAESELIALGAKTRVLEAILGRLPRVSPQ